jgi:hypothetical protein
VRQYVPAAASKSSGTCRAGGSAAQRLAARSRDPGNGERVASITAEEILEAVRAPRTSSTSQGRDGRPRVVQRVRALGHAADARPPGREHLAALDHLRQGIHLRGYAQKNPKQEYKREAFELFAAMLDAIKQEVTRIVMNVQIQSPEQLEEAAEQIEEQGGHLENVEFQHADYAESGAPVANVAVAAAATADMVGSAMTHGGAGGDAEGRPQRPVPVRQRQEVQAVPRQAVMIGGGAHARAASFAASSQ